MIFLVAISVLVCASQVFCACPRKDELHCNFYDTTNCPAGTSVTSTYITVGGERCDGCSLCFPDTAGGCPDENCPYKNIREKFPADCGIKTFAQKTRTGNCKACATFTKDCSDTSWVG